MLGDWTDAYKAGQTYTCLADGALQYIDSRLSDDRHSYDKLVQGLRDRYEGEVERQRARDRLRIFRSCRQESLDDLATRIKELPRKAYPPERREEEGVAALKVAFPLNLARTIVSHG